MWLALYVDPRAMPSCSRSTKSRKSRCSIAPSPVCRWTRVAPKRW